MTQQTRRASMVISHVKHTLQKEVILWIQSRLLVVVKLCLFCSNLGAGDLEKFLPKGGVTEKVLEPLSEGDPLYSLNLGNKCRKICVSIKFSETRERTQPLILKGLIPSTMSLQWLHRVHGIPHIFPK